MDFCALMQLAGGAQSERAQKTAAAQVARERDQRAKLEADDAKARREEAKRRELLERARDLARRDAERERERLSAAAAAAAAAAERTRRKCSPSEERPPPKKRLSTADLRNRQVSNLVTASRSRSSSPASPAGPTRKLTVVPTSGPLPVASTSSTTSGSSTSGMTARARLLASFDPAAIHPLNTVKRDLRTVDEVERDMRARKAPPGPASCDDTPERDVGSFFHLSRPHQAPASPVPIAGPSKATMSKSAGDNREPARPRPAESSRAAPSTKRLAEGVSRAKPPPSSSMADSRRPPAQTKRPSASSAPPRPSPVAVGKPRATEPSRPSPSTKRARGDSPPLSKCPRVDERPRSLKRVRSDDEDDRRPTKSSATTRVSARARSRDRPTGSSGARESLRRSPSPGYDPDEIWRIMGRDRSHYVANDRLSDEDDDSAASYMDTGYADIDEEEREATRQARRDDAREEATLRKAKEAKERRKAERAAR